MVFPSPFFFLEKEERWGCTVSLEVCFFVFNMAGRHSAGPVLLVTVFRLAIDRQKARFL